MEHKFKVGDQVKYKLRYGYTGIIESITDIGAKINWSKKNQGASTEYFKNIELIKSVDGVNIKDLIEKLNNLEQKLNKNEYRK